MGNLITCMMSSSAPDQAGPDCFKEFGVDYQPVMDCIESGEGAQLHADNGETQNSRHPSRTMCPGSTWTRSTWLSTGSWRSMASRSSFVILLTPYLVKKIGGANSKFMP